MLRYRLVGKLLENQIVKAVEAKVEIGIGISVDGYMLSNGTIRYGQDYISLLLGYSKGYVSRLTIKSPKKLKTLLGLGFTGDVISVSVPRIKGGATRAKTLSFSDFCIFVEYEASEEVQNPKAIALLASSFRELVIERTRQAFGLPELPLEEKQAAFRETYDTYLDRLEDEEDLLLPGDALERPDICPWEDYQALANRDELVEFYANYDFDKEVLESAFTRQNQWLQQRGRHYLCNRGNQGSRFSRRRTRILPARQI